MRIKTRGTLGVLGVLGALFVVPAPADADTTLPTWTCRASAAYAELDLLVGTTRVEPVLANGFPDRVTPDRETCASAATGVQDTDVPAGAPILTLNAASARTELNPAIGAARDQDVLAEGGVANGTTVNIAGLTITADAVRAQVTGDCVGTTPTFVSESDVVDLQVDGTPIELLGNGDVIDVGLVRISLNQTIEEGDAASQVQAHTRRALEIEVLPVGGGEPLSRVVVGEAKADRNGAVCAAAPPPASCPAGTVPQQGSDPLVCVLTQTAPCPAGSTSDPNRGGACVIVSPPGPCPSGTLREPNSGACIFVLQRPCPPGSTADQRTRVCVVVAGSSGPGGGNTLVLNGRENGRIGSVNGPPARCGRVTMRFVKGGKLRLTNRLGTRVVTRGRLVSCEKRPRPIVGARIDVIHVLPDGRRLRKTGLRSRGDGKLTLILPNDLRTRKIEYGYRPNLDTAKVSSRVTLNLIVRNKAGRTLR